MVRNHDAIDADLLAARGIGRLHDSLNHHRAWPLLADLAQVLPVQMAAVGKVPHNACRQGRRPPGRVVVLEVRHSMLHKRAQESSKQPARMHHPLVSQRNAWPKRRGESCAYIVFPIRLHWRVDRHDQSLDTGFAHAFD
ncbi:hypothetical protein D3C72_1899560 [compost metagenome]